MSYWLMKSEPEVFGIEHLVNCPQQTEPWNGVRNYQARNMLRDAMQDGDLAFFYHSNCATPGIVGIMRIVSAAYPDPSAFEPQSAYFDPRSTVALPTWYCVNVQLVRKLTRTISLTELKTYEHLQDFSLVKRGNRLSIMPVTSVQWAFILSLE